MTANDSLTMDSINVFEEDDMDLKCAEMMIALKYSSSTHE
jgi:hypothetical protein